MSKDCDGVDMSKDCDGVDMSNEYLKTVVVWTCQKTVMVWTCQTYGRGPYRAYLNESFPGTQQIRKENEGRTRINWMDLQGFGGHRNAVGGR